MRQDTGVNASKRIRLLVKRRSGRKEDTKATSVVIWMTLTASRIRNDREIMDV